MVIANGRIVRIKLLMTSKTTIYDLLFTIYLS